MKALKTVAAVVCLCAVFAILLFLPAGSFSWWEAWLYLAIQCAYTTLVAIYLSKYNQKLLKERITFRGRMQGWDKAIVYSSVVPFIVLFAVSALDATQYHWSFVPLVAKALAFAGVVVGLVIMFLAMRENTFLSRVVKIQEGHRVITTGPYSIVRHPMYVGFIITFSCLPIALGSWYGLIGSAGVTVAILLRTRFEDRMLQKELPGYEEYSKKTRYRIVPGVW